MRQVASCKRSTGENGTRFIRSSTVKMERSPRVALSDKTNFPGLLLAGGRSWKRPSAPTPPAEARAVLSETAPTSGGGRRALELGLSPAKQSVAADDPFAANQSWPGPAPAASVLAADAAGADMMPWDTPPMRRPKPDSTLLKGDNLFSFSFNGATTRSPYRSQQRASDAAARSLNDSWAFYKSFSPADVLPLLNAQTLFITPTKSVFTIDSKTSQILMWNDMAADLLGYSGSELSQLRLRDLFVAADSRPRMEEAHLSSQGSVVVFAGNVVEVKTKKGDVIPVSLWLRKIETSTSDRRCVAVLEPVQRKTVLMTCDQYGRLMDVSGGVRDLFSQEPDGFVGLKAAHFMPSLKLPTDLENIPKELSVQEVTAKRPDGGSFPVSVRLTVDTPTHTIFLRVHAYTSLMGLVVMDEDLKIRNYNHNFISLTFGYEKGDLLEKDVRQLIPTFEEDMEMMDSDDDSLSLPPVYEDPLPAPAAALARLTLHDPPPPPPPMPLPARQPVQGDETRPAESPSSPGGDGPPATSTPGPRSSAGRRRRPPLTDNTYYGLARHRDGSEFNITYDLCTIGLDDDSIVYCLWIGQDRPEPQDSLLSADMSAGVAHYSLGQVIQQQAAAAAAAAPAAVPDAEDTEHCRGEYNRYYTTIQQIGKGAFGFVKLSYRNGDRMLVVTKFIRKDKVHADHWVDDPTLSRRVPLEVSLLSMLHHPHIIGVLDVYENAQYMQMVMERHGCMDLFEFIDRDPAMDELLASHIFRQICSALHHLHSLEILHRDVKDENVIIDSSFHIKLIDFGSATFVSRGHLLSTFCGTVEYCAPEVLQGNKYDGYMLEMWSLGVTLFTLLCGENPFHDVDDTISKPLRLPAEITPNLAHLLTGLLEKSPGKRLRLSQVTEHPWTVQQVDMTAYKFEEVVACSALEVSPPRFLSTAGLDGDQLSSGAALSFSSLTHATPPKYGRLRERRDLARRDRVRSDETALGCVPAGGDPLHQSLHQ